MYTTIFNIQHFSVNDGPGIRTVVFFKGCPLSCAWCHNPESKSKEKELSFAVKNCTLCGKCAAVCPNGVHTFENGMHLIDRNKCSLCGKCADVCVMSALEILGKRLTCEEIMIEIAKDDVFITTADGGVTFSGGEPFMHFEALYELLKLCKIKGYSTCIETSGYANTENIVRASDYTDWFLYDCKETDPENHKKFIGTDNSLILKNLSVLNDAGAKVILRCPIIPGVNDRAEHFENIAALSKKYTCIKSVEFMPYHPLGIQKAVQIGKTSAFSNENFMDKKRLERLCAAVKNKMTVPVKIN